MAGEWVVHDDEAPPREKRREGWVVTPAPRASGAYQNPNSLYEDTIETQVRGRPAPATVPRAPAPNLAMAIGRFFTGEGNRQDGVGEIAYQSVPEARDQRFEGPLSPVANALPRPVRNWIGAEQKAAGVGLGFFLNPNERARAQIIERQIPSAQFRRDEYGNLQVRYNETRPWAYINKPGASVEDLQTFANEIGKYLTVRRLTGGAAAPVGSTPLGTSTAVEVARGALTSTLGQGASMPLGAEEINAGDVAISGVGGGVGNVVGHGVTSLARNAPPIVRDAVTAIGDRLPGGPERVAARQAFADQAQQRAEEVARMHARSMVEAYAAEAKMTGEALEKAIASAEAEAVNVVRAQFAQAPASAGREARNLDLLARSFGVRLAKAQTEGDAAGMQFLYEAAGGMHGSAAQRQATAFLSAQNQALPQAIRSIVPDVGVTSPQSAVSMAREGMVRAREGVRAEENAAWKAFDDASENVRTYDVTPSGNPGAVTTVRARMQEALVADKKMVRPLDENGAPTAPQMLAEFKETYPRVARVMALTDRMATGTKAEVPLRDIDRVVQLKRFIDSEWEAADTDAERRLLTMLGREVRGWLKNPQGGYRAVEGGGRAAGSLKGRGAEVTHERLAEALAVSERSAKTFRESDFIQRMLDERAPMTDQELTTRLFGGGEAGLNVSSDSLRALEAMKEALGPSSPEWNALRQAALQRLTRGLDDAIATNQTPAILTTFKRIDEAFRRNREAMGLLFTPDELARLREAQRVVAAMAPTPRNPANPTNSGITAARATKGALSMIGDMLKDVPAANMVVGGADDAVSAARVNVEIGGAAKPGFNLARRLASALWDVADDGAGAPVGAGYATVAGQDGQYPPR